MKKYLILLLVPAAVALWSSGCKKDDKCSAGTGGNLTMVVYPEHHGAAIINHAEYPDTVMVKFNTQEFPGANPALYDLVISGEAGEDHVHVEGLTCGDYYIYAKGWDTTLAPPDTIVKGGIPVSTTQTSGELIVKVPVTE
jgi:hypothetical protein